MNTRKNGKFEKINLSEWGGVFAGKTKSNPAILGSSLCSLRGADQGNLEKALAENDDGLYNEES